MDGRICVAESVCPHLGADLGPAAGGRVHDGCLICPFHGYRYDATGQCVATPYAPAPKSAKLRVFEVCEIAGLIFAWQSSSARSPQWTIPDPGLEAKDWCAQHFQSVRFKGHPQDTTENAVDYVHLSYVHGYGSLKEVDAISIEGAWLKSCFNFTRTQTIAGIKCFTYDVSTISHIHGLGYSFIEVYERHIGMDIRLWVLATPIDHKILELTLVSQMRHLVQPKRPIIGLRFLPVRLRTWIMNRITAAAQMHDVLQDVIIWENKSYRPRPALCRSDGPVGKFRRYSAQFYPDGQFDDQNNTASGSCSSAREFHK